VKKQKRASSGRFVFV